MEVTVHKEHRLRSSSVVLIALILANCAKAPPPGGDLGGLGAVQNVRDIGDRQA